MGRVALQQWIASAYVIAFGVHGEITRQAQGRGVSGQRLYREHALVFTALAGTAWQQEKEQQQRRILELEQRNAVLEKRLTQAVVLDKEKQKELARVTRAVGVRLPACQILLQVFLGQRAPKVSTLGRWTKAAGEKEGELLAVLDAFTYGKMKQAVADEIYTKKPVLMVVEPYSIGHLNNCRTNCPHWKTQNKKVSSGAPTETNCPAPPSLTVSKGFVATPCGL